jgi:hypothetical protein
MNLLTQNSKLKETSKKLGLKIFNFSIPAYKSKSGKVVCPFAESCVKYCYAQKGNYKRFPKVAEGMEERFLISKSLNFVALMDIEINKKKADAVRIHDSGDFYNNEYIEKWVNIAMLNPNVNFYAYTKSIPLFKGRNLPKNMDVIFSFGSKKDELIDVNNDRHARIFNNETELINAGYINASKIDYYATKFYSENKKVGLIYH